MVNFADCLIMPMALDMSIMLVWANDQNAAHLHAKTVSMNLIWSESAQWLLSSSVRKDSRGLYHAHDHTHYAPMGKWPCRCTSTGQDSSKVSTQWLLSSGVHKIPMMPMGMPIGPMGQWPCRCMSTGHDSSNELDLEWVSPLVAEFQHQQDSRGFIMPMGMPIMPPWANDHDVAHLQAKTVPKNLIWSELAKWLLSCGIRKIPRAFIMPMGMPIMPPWANDYNFAHL